MARNILQPFLKLKKQNALKKKKKKLRYSVNSVNGINMNLLAMYHFDRNNLLQEDSPYII